MTPYASSRGSDSTSMPMKNSKPSTATGTPKSFEYVRDVTFMQLTDPVSGQASVVPAVKCS